METPIWVNTANLRRTLWSATWGLLPVDWRSKNLPKRDIPQSLDSGTCGICGFKKTSKKQDLTTCGMAISIPVSMARAKTSTPAELHGPPNPGPNGFQLDSLFFLSCPQTVHRTWACPKNGHPKNLLE